MFLFNPCDPCCGGCSYTGKVSLPTNAAYGDPASSPQEIVPYLLDNDTGEVCSYSNPSGTNMTYDGSTNTITFTGTSSKRYVAWYNAPAVIPSSANIFGGLSSPPFQLTLTNKSVATTAVFVNDIELPVVFYTPTTKSITLSLCGDTCVGQYQCDSYLGNGTGDQSNYRKGTIIDIDCKTAGNCDCLPSGNPTLSATMFDTDLSGNPVLTTTTAQPIGSGNCWWGGNFPSTSRRPNGVGFYVTSRRHAGSVEFFINPSGQLDLSESGVASYQSQYASDHQLNQSYSHVIEQIEPYYSPGLRGVYRASCDPCLFIPSYVPVAQGAGSYTIGLSSPTIVLSPYADKFYVPSACGNCSTINNTLYFNLDNLTWEGWGCINLDLPPTSGSIGGYTIPLLLNAFTQDGMQYDSGTGVYIHIGFLQYTDNCANGVSGVPYGTDLYIDRVKLLVDDCNIRVEMDFLSVGVSGAYGLGCWPGVSLGPTGDSYAAITSCSPFAVEGSLPCTTIGGSNCSPPGCSTGMASPSVEFNNILFSITE